MLKYRRDLHEIPEIDFDLPKTHNYVKKVLENLGFKINVYAKTGIVVTKKGKTNETYAFRADMDALLINKIILDHKEIELSAQVQTINFYKKLGFRPIGEVYLEANIKHQKMIYNKENNKSE